MARPRGPGPRFGRQPTSRSPRPFVPVGISSSPAPVGGREVQLAREREQGGDAPGGRGRRARGARPRRSRRGRSARCSFPFSTRSRSAASAPARREADRRRRRSRRACVGWLEATTTFAPRRRRALRTRRSTIGASSTRSVSNTSTAAAFSMSQTGTLRSGRARIRAWSGSSTPLGRESTCGEPSASRTSRWSRKPSSFVVSPPASPAVAAPAFSSPAAAADRARAPRRSRAARRRP